MPRTVPSAETIATSVLLFPASMARTAAGSLISGPGEVVAVVRDDQRGDARPEGQDDDGNDESGGAATLPALPHVELLSRAARPAAEGEEQDRRAEHDEAEDERCRWFFELEADAFLHHMIRNIMGCLVAIGQGNQPPSWIRQVLAALSRDAAAPTFSPDGLYFQGPVYDADWGLPQRTAAYDWLP